MYVARMAVLCDTAILEHCTPSFIEENGLPQLVASGTIPGTLSSRFYGLETNK
jgi:hypothetical protein